MLETQTTSSANAEKMSYTEFIKAVAEKTRVPEDTVRQVYDEGSEIIGNETFNGRSVEIRNFGVFKTKQVQGRNVKLNNVSTFKPYTKFQFKPSSRFTKQHRMAIGEIENDD